MQTRNTPLGIGIGLVACGIWVLVTADRPRYDKHDRKQQPGGGIVQAIGGIVMIVAGGVLVAVAFTME